MGLTHAISAGHYLAAQVGFQILEAGGNAVDAGVAAGIVLGVVQSDRVNFGGVAPQMIYLAGQKTIHCIDGVGPWPSAMTPDYFRTHHDGKIPLGVLRSVVPAAPSAWLLSLEKFGTLSFGEAAAAAIDLARNGFPMYPLMSGFIAKNQARYESYPSSRDIYIIDGKPPKVGTRFVQADLAATLQYMVDEERAKAGEGRTAGLRAAHDAFYKGDIAGAIARFHAESGGFVTREDLSAYQARFEEPVSARYRGIDIFACGPWTQGPVVPMALRILEGFDLRSMGHNSPEYIHCVTEALKLAFADRHHYFGDPAFVDVPMAALLSDDYTDYRRSKLSMDTACPGMPDPGDVVTRRDLPARWMPPPADDDAAVPWGDTTHLCVVDRFGNAFSATPSDSTATSPIIPGLGLVCSPRGLASWADSTHPSSVAAGKRPRLTPNPAIAVKQGELVMPFGSPGGDVQPQAMLQVLLNRLVFGMEMQDAVEAPRFTSYSFPSTFEPHQYYPGRLYLESRIEPATAAALEGKGHRIYEWPEFSSVAGAVCAIHADLRSGTLYAGADPRRPSQAAAR